ncbi:DUF3429 domain-containing protein [Marinicauda salina]|nr:DUF3429 domain-containing protein [Marinicauda salina]
MKRLADAPFLPVALGFAGLIPFVGGAVGLAIGGPIALQSANALPIYAAVILSFLAGGRWAAEIVIRADAPRGGVMLLSVLIALAGWIAVLMQVWNRPGLGFNAELAGWLVLIAGFAVSYLWDRAAVRGATFPEWYQPLRLLLTGGAMLSLAVAAWIRTSPTFSL